MRSVKHGLIGLFSIVFLLAVLPLESEAGKWRKYFNNHVSHKDLRGDHEQLEYDNRKTHEWLEKIEKAIEELEPEAVGPPCGAGTEGQRFVADDQEVCDNTTGLYWVKTLDTTSRTHAAALTHCAGLNLGNSQTYRLPEVKELISLVDYSQSNPALPADHPFSGVEFSPYWSATTLATNSTDGWFVRFNDGLVGTPPKTAPLFVWCARSGN